MNAKNDLFFLIFVVIGLAVAWFASGGPERVDEGFFLSPPPPLGTGQLYGPSLTPGPQSSQNIEQSIRNAEKELKRVEKELAEATFFGDPSAYKDMVQFERRSGSLKQTDPDQEYVVLQASARNRERILLTGWRLSNEVTNESFEIPGASALPYSGKINAEHALFLAPGEEVIIATGRSPIGVSFKENSCTGYFGKFQSFTPTLDLSCPLPQTEVPLGSPLRFDDVCMDYIERIPRCTVTLKALPIELDNTCQSFITTELTYNSCVENHKHEGSFYKNVWRVYLKRDHDIWSNGRGALKLLDATGKTVDVFTY